MGYTLKNHREKVEGKSLHPLSDLIPHIFYKIRRNREEVQEGVSMDF